MYNLYICVGLDPVVKTKSRFETSCIEIKRLGNLSKLILVHPLSSKIQNFAGFKRKEEKIYPFLGLGLFCENKLCLWDCTIFKPFIN